MTSVKNNMYQEDWHNKGPYFEDCLSEVLAWCAFIALVIWGLSKLI